MGHSFGAIRDMGTPDDRPVALINLGQNTWVSLAYRSLVDNI